MSKVSAVKNLSTIGRRKFLMYTSLLPILSGCAGAIRSNNTSAESSLIAKTTTKVQSSWEPYPVFPNLIEHNIEVEGATLWCTDTGGNGTPIVLLHAHTGSALNWGYQQRFFAEKGFRVIAYSRRGYYGSKVDNEEGLLTAVSASADLFSVVEALNLDKFHLVGTAAGGMIVSDFALSHPDKILSMTIACSLVGIADADYVEGTKRILTKEFMSMSPVYKELSGSYILANPAGVEEWKKFEKLSKPNKDAFDFSAFRKSANKITSDKLWNIKTPTLVLTGDADPYFPQWRARKVAKMFPNSHYVLIPESSHSPYWEQYELFNESLLAFFKSATAS